VPPLVTCAPSSVASRPAVAMSSCPALTVAARPGAVRVLTPEPVDAVLEASVMSLPANSPMR
jgi:hypothetical protein